MHELSIAMSILDVVEEEMQKHAGSRLEAIHLRVGPFAGVVEEALVSAYELAREQTPYPSSRLVFVAGEGRQLEIAALELEDG